MSGFEMERYEFPNLLAVKFLYKGRAPGRCGGIDAPVTPGENARRISACKSHRNAGSDRSKSLKSKGEKQANNLIPQLFAFTQSQKGGTNVFQ